MIVTGELDWTDRSVFVTGATGLLGGWLVESLVDRGASVTCLVRDEVPASRFHREGIDAKVTTVRGDLVDGVLLERVLAEREVRTVFHVAAQAIVPVANRNAMSTFDTNIRGTWLLLEASRRSPLVTEIVVASSDKAYGHQPVLPYTEDMPLQGRHPYDVSKACADLITQSFASTWGVPAVITRCGNFFGGGDLNFNRLVPGVIRDVLRGRPPEIRSDGRAVRDYLYVQDGAEAYIALAEALRTDPSLSGRAFNFSVEQPMDVLSVVQRILDAMGTDLVPAVLDSAPNEIAEQYLDASLAREQLGWYPAVGFDEGLRRTIDWYSGHLGSDP